MPLWESFNLCTHGLVSDIWMVFLRANENRIEYRESGNAVHGVSVSTGNHYSTRSNFNT